MKRYRWRSGPVPSLELLIMTALSMGGAGGCGLSHTVDRDLLTVISIEYKMTLFDAENDLSIAMDERERIQQEIQATKQDVRDAEAQVVEAESDAERASLKGEAEKVDIADMAADVFQLKIGYLTAEISFLRERLTAQDALIDVAMAKYELAKAKLVKKNNVHGAADIELVDFEEQVDAYVERAKAGQQVLSEVRTEVDAIKAIWLEQREQLSSASGGGIGSPWAEDSALWGSQ